MTHDLRLREMCEVAERNSAGTAQMGVNENEIEKLKSGCPDATCCASDSWGDRMVYNVDIGTLPSHKAQKTLRRLQAECWGLQPN